MQNENTQLILSKDDYQLLTSYLNGGRGKTPYDRNNAQILQAELKKAKVVDASDFPHDVVRINSTVVVKMEENGKILELKVVTPDRADIRQNKISVLAPIGTALIGFRRGEKVSWLVPAGKRVFTIMDVLND